MKSYALIIAALLVAAAAFGQTNESNSSGEASNQLTQVSVLSAILSQITGEKVATGALNIIFGLGSYLDGDLTGGLTLTAGYVVAAGLFVVEVAVLDWDSPAVGVPATIGVVVAGMTLVYGFVRPFLYNRSPRAAAVLDNTRLNIVPAADIFIERNTGVQLSYTFRF
jgi:hypothetical protein